MSGSHSHSGGGGGSHSHGGGSGVGPETLVVSVVISAVVVLGVEAIGWLGQHIYEATHPVHIVYVAGDWGSLYLNIGLSAVLGAVGILLLIATAISRKVGLLVVAGISLASAGACGLLLAPHFEAKVIERSPADPSRLRPPAAVRQMVPRRVSLRCVDGCRNGRVSDHYSVLLQVHHMPIGIYKRLCSAGYADEWAGKSRPLVSYGGDKTLDEQYLDCNAYDRMDPDSKDIEVRAAIPGRAGAWRMTWRLKDPTGMVAASSTYSVVVGK